MQMETPIGTLRLIASSDSVLCIEKGELQEDRILHSNPSGELLQQCGQELKEYFAGKRRRFDLPLAPEGTNFQKNVWAQLQNIPYGETRTYRELAEMTGNAKAARAVGMANHCNSILIVVPCHRVIGADGSLTGYAAGLEAKKYLLRLEEGLAHA
ncbi:MAG: methylated-DNA--[protein]-cysteine S-methyltransferase [Oscillospiraceae bacterium]|nr:methylated-DNA--[protein]-cysteine S-methyltransferase [Oscillospiraceae bacterium]